MVNNNNIPQKSSQNRYVRCILKLRGSIRAFICRNSNKRFNTIQIIQKVVLFLTIGIVLKELVAKTFVTDTLSSLTGTSSVSLESSVASLLLTSTSLHASIHAFDNVTEKIMSVTDIQEHMNLHNISIETTPIIYFITPTVHTNTQMLDLTRLSQSLQHDKGIYWIVIEDNPYCTQRIRDILVRSGLMYAHTASQTPISFRNTAEAVNRFARGVNQRNRGLEIVNELTSSMATLQDPQQQRQLQLRQQLPPGVVYFGDDDNAYDIRLFNGLRQLQPGRVGVFGVAFVGGGMYDRCIVNATTGLVHAILSNWHGPQKPKWRHILETFHVIKYVNHTRMFDMDMGGYAFSTILINQYQPRFSYLWLRGFLETTFVQLLNISSVHQFQPLMHNCTALYVWHVKTQALGSNHIEGDSIYQLIENLA
jgi:hypothetical protein